MSHANEIVAPGSLSAWTALERQVEAAIGRATRGEWTALREQAAVMEAAARTLRQGPPPDHAEECRERLDKLVRILEQVLRHAAQVQAGLLQIGVADRDGYSRHGAAAGRGTHLNREA